MWLQGAPGPLRRWALTAHPAAAGAVALPRSAMTVTLTSISRPLEVRPLLDSPVCQRVIYLLVGSKHRVRVLQQELQSGAVC